MDVLYFFWAHFLIRNFNERMYAEFHSLALEDSQKQLDIGLKCLYRYYKHALISPHRIPDIVASNFAKLLNGERDNGDKPAFEKLKSAWTDPTANVGNKEKLAGMIREDLRMELASLEQPEMSG
jgi:la-related protein 1